MFSPHRTLEKKDEGAALLVRGNQAPRLHPHGRCVCCMLDLCFHQANLKRQSKVPVFSKHFQGKFDKTQSKSQTEQQKSKERQPKAAQSTRRSQLTAQETSETRQRSLASQIFSQNQRQTHRTLQINEGASSILDSLTHLSTTMTESKDATGQRLKFLV